MLTPGRIEHLQQHVAAEARPGVVPDEFFLGLFDGGGRLDELVEQIFVGGLVARLEHGLHVDVQTPVVLEVVLQTGQIPLLFDGFGRHAGAEQIREEAVAQIVDHLADVLALEDLVAQTVDFATLIVLHVVELE